ncbi:DUF4956 domain-containing protein [Salipaludibacillus agaradhaerens]|uniref:DUF4956 domain-containing protein n=1 Tax=Salipaludibacillus agaradhaerens TaxID=76935 RepID=UPI002151AB20|nr:DUF4956 domain-containing protein [Salipaludibacillus agaradhaerens]MCR6105065.1 DUF4956 domain-containing protein [Salipaludibacillus agaradhaerens]MCR6109154.1 DUF4956 domain-containing protein [Bacillus sp. A301a_S52]MCR6117110.1 DUF4956 domain-containing protein [Salipaludibacillus agaradhaerens]UJW56308.1 DUF4956 domain-containing protein [Bacillus sp. A116_S68]
MENEQLSFSDFLQTDVLDHFQTDITLIQIVITMAVSLAIGMFIYTLYKRTFSGVLYSKNFNITLIGLAMITSFVIMAIGSNLILSLGMVGALSIVRFRTPIKDPTDLVFLFWALAAGIVAGAGFYTLAILGSLIVGLVLFIIMKKTTAEIPYLFVVNCLNNESEKVVYQQLKEQVNRFNVKQKTVTADQIEITLEIRLKGNEPDFVNHIASLKGVENAVLISYNGDYLQ